MIQSALETLAYCQIAYLSHSTVKNLYSTNVND